MIRIGGIAFGIDTHQMIDELMRAERMPLDCLFQQRTWVEWQRDAYREVNLALSKFRDVDQKLRLQATFNAYTALSSQENIATATTTSGAVPGSYSIQVIQLAEAAKLTSVNAIKNHDGSEQVRFNTNVFKVIDGYTDEQLETLTAEDLEQLKQEFTITVGSGAETRTATITIDFRPIPFAFIATKISRAAVDDKSLGLRASFDDTTGRFFISSRETGADQEITFTDNEHDFVQNFIIGGTPSGSNITHDAGNKTFTVQGQNANFTFDGIAIESKTNTVRVHGLDITVKEVGSTTLTIQSDADKVIEDIKHFVNSYNELIATLQAKLDEPRYRDYPALTNEQRKELSDKEIELWEEKAKSGLLRNDSLIRSILSDLRLAFSNPVEGIPAGEIRLLSQIGITTSKDWRQGGKLEIDEDKLRQALMEKPDEVRNLFTQRRDEGTELAPGKRESDYDGIGYRMQSIINNAVSRLREKAGSPGLANKADQSNLGKELSRFDERIAKFEQRLAMIEERYWRQFTAMEKAIADMNSAKCLDDAKLVRGHDVILCQQIENSSLTSCIS